MASSLSTLSARIVVGRIGAAVFGGYVFIWGFMALSLASLYALDMPFHDAEHLSSILGLLLYLIVFLWAFAAQNFVRVWLVLVGGGLLMSVAASLLQDLLV